MTERGRRRNQKALKVLKKTIGVALILFSLLFGILNHKLFVDIQRMLCKKSWTEEGKEKLLSLYSAESVARKTNGKFLLDLNALNKAAPDAFRAVRAEGSYAVGFYKKCALANKTTNSLELGVPLFEPVPVLGRPATPGWPKVVPRFVAEVALAFKAEPDHQCKNPDEGFDAIAVARLCDDIDIWSINEKGELRHVRDIPTDFELSMRKQERENFIRELVLTPVEIGLFLIGLYLLFWL